jgi:hypothetical protein
VALGAAWAARGDSANLRLEETFGAQRARFTDATGVTTDTDSINFGQRYRLTVDRSLYESIRLNLDGAYEEPRSWLRSEGTSQETLLRRWSGNGGLTFGTPILGGGLSYQRREETGESWSTTGNEPRLYTRSPTLVNDAYTGYLGWRPVDLPSVALRIARTNDYDKQRAVSDTTTDSATLTTDYVPVKQLDLGYTVSYVDANDRFHGSESTSVSEAARAAYRENFFGRTSAYVSYNLGTTTRDVRAQGLGGTVATPRPPLAGLSLVETFPAVPTQDTLKPNPALVDGNTTDGAGINLGFSRSLAGDTVPRDLGMQFAIPVQPLNTIWVWVDRQLPVDISTRITWTAYQSDDGQTWSKVDVLGSVFGTLENRFEITLPQISPKFVKVVASPLPFSATTDPRYSDIAVTEVQAFLVVQAASVAGRTTTTSNAINGTATTRILDSPSLMHDLSFAMTSPGAPLSSGTIWLVTNGLGANNRIGKTASWSARVARSDSGGATPHQGQWTWGGSLATEPIPTLAAGVAYSGTEAESATGTRLSNNVSATGRADLYPGVALSGNAGYGVGRDERDRTSQALQASASGSVTPNRVIAVNGSYSVNRAVGTGGDQPRSFAIGQQMVGGVMLTPFPSLTASGSVIRLLATGQTPLTLLSAQVGFSPFRGGDVVRNASHTESYQSDTQSKSRITAAGLTWKIRSGTLLDAGYSLSDSSTPAQKATAQAVNARLTVSL